MHRARIADLGFTIACDEWVTLPSAITRDELAPRFRHLPDGDLTTSSAFIHAVKALR